MVHNLCASNYYFRTCFEVKENDCIRAISDTYETCFSNDFKNPVIDPQTEGQSLAYVNGVCLGNKLEKKWKRIKVHSKKECRDINKWL